MNRVLLIVLTVLFTFSGVAQDLTGKKLLKSANALMKVDKDAEALDLLTKNYSSEDKLAPVITLEIGKLYAEAKKLDSANWYLKLSEESGNSKNTEEIERVRNQVEKAKELYQLEMLTGWRAFDKKDFVAANLNFDAALIWDIGNYEVYQAKGEILAKEGENRKAIKWYTQALTHYFHGNKEKAHAYEHLADAQLSLGQGSHTINSCDLGLELTPENKELFFLKARAYSIQGLNSEANTYFIKVIRLQPDHVRSWFYCGESYFKMKDYPKAVKSLSTCLRYDSTYYEAYGVRGEANFAMEKYQDAKRDFELFSFRVDSNDYAMNAAGICDFKSGNYQDAVKSFEQAVDLNPSKSYRYNLVRGYIANNQNKEALVICEAIAQSNRSDIRYNVVHVQSLMNLMRYKDAENYLNESIDSNPYVLEYLELGVELFELTGNKAASKNAESISGNLEVDRRNHDLRF